MQGTPMNKNRPMRQESGGTWRAYSAQILLIEEKRIYTFCINMAAILNVLTSLMLFIIYTLYVYFG